MIRRRTAALACPAALVAVTLLVGCGSGDPEPAASSASTASAPATPTSGSDATSAGNDADEEGGATTGAGAEGAAFVADTRPDTAEASADSRVTVTEIRTGRQEGFDRVVLEVGGTGTPGWDVRYVDQPASQGRGDALQVAGEAVLQVTLTGVGYPYDTGIEEWAGPDPLPGNGTRTVTEVVWDATFEGTSVAFVGTRAEVPFRVYALEQPTRVVVEVADQS
ncbi:hypothetical protein ACI784_15315 [Geodermatophilus sp. SYSU D01186]